jgi:CRP-like cAMP-binding protein
MGLSALIDSIHPISEPSKEILMQFFHERNLPKKHILFQADKIEEKIYILKKGIVRAYYDTEDKDITFWFGIEGDPILPMKAYVSNDRIYENIELLEDSLLFEIKIADLQKLYASNIEIANWGRRLAEKEMVQTEELFISRQFKTATDRYRDLMKHHPEILQRVPLKIIASYLGITQVSLSRIRAEIK